MRFLLHPLCPSDISPSGRGRRWEISFTTLPRISLWHAHKLRQCFPSFAIYKSGFGLSDKLLRDVSFSKRFLPTNGWLDLHEEPISDPTPRLALARYLPLRTEGGRGLKKNGFLTLQERKWGGPCEGDVLQSALILKL